MFSKKKVLHANFFVIFKKNIRKRPIRGKHLSIKGTLQGAHTPSVENIFGGAKIILNILGGNVPPFSLSCGQDL